MLSVRVFLVLIASVLILQSTCEAVAGKKINVLVLYESLCPDSKDFMQFQLKPHYNALKDVIDITLVPFGKSQSINNGERFFCQHGPEECDINRLQSCALHQTTNQETQVNFAICQMTTYVKDSPKYCAESVGLTGESIDECIYSNLGTALQLEAEKITHSYNPSFVPTIVYEGEFNQQLQDNSLTDFKGVVCGLLQTRNPLAFNSVC